MLVHKTLERASGSPHDLLLTRFLPPHKKPTFNTLYTKDEKLARELFPLTLS